MKTQELSSELHNWFSAHPGVIVAFSAGVDSTLVVALAARCLSAERVLAVTGDSPSLARRELAHAEALAAQLAVSHVVLKTDEFYRPEYSRNDHNRCYVCKSSLYSCIRQAMGTGRLPAEFIIADGTNADDLNDDRPGLIAARELGIRHPFVELGIGKQRVRELAKQLELENFDKPASPCLASRVARGTAVNAELLSKVERAEDELYALGYRGFRVRVEPIAQGAGLPCARIEFEHASLKQVLADALRHQEIVAKVQDCGFIEARVDPEGYRRGGASRLTILGGS